MQPERADMSKDLGACPGSQATPGAAEEASPPIGFDPARWQWESGPCFDRLGHVSSYDICHPQEPGARGVAVVASCYEGCAVAAFIASAPLMFRALQVIVDMEPEQTNAEAKWMAGVARAAIASAMSAGTAATTQIGAGLQPASAVAKPDAQGPSQ